MSSQMKPGPSLSRQHVLKREAAALGGGALVAGAGPGAQNAQAPGVLSNAQTGRSIRGRC